MTSMNLLRWSGLAALIGGVLTVISALLRLPLLGFASISEVATTGTYAFDTFLYLLAMIMVLGGLVGLYASQSEAAGLLGMVGFLAAFLGTALVLGYFWAQAFFLPGLAETAPELLGEDPPGWLYFGYTLTFLLASLGWLLFGVATLLARIYPRPAAVLLIGGGAIGFIPFIPYALVPFIPAMAIAWLGYNLFARRGEEVRQPTPVR